MARFKNVSNWSPISSVFYLFFFCEFWILFDLLQKNKKALARPVKNQPSVDHITGQKIPKSFVFSRGKLPGPLRDLELDLRKLMLPHTALKLKVIGFIPLVRKLVLYGFFMSKRLNNKNIRSWWFRLEKIIMANFTRGIQAMSIEHYMSNRASIFRSYLFFSLLLLS